jgi:hypothetical protein
MLRPRPFPMRGAPATVAAETAVLDEHGIGGVIARFRLGPLPPTLAAESLRLFMRAVAPRFPG